MVKSVASVLPLLFVLCIVSFPIRSTEAHGLSYLQKVCKRAVRYNNLINYDFCLNTLQAVPESYTTEIGGLLEITTHLTLQNVTDTTNIIKRLSSITCDQLLKGQLLACQTQYDLAAAQLGSFSHECALKTYIGKENLAAIIDYTLKCDESLKRITSDGRVQASGLLTNENNNVKQLVSIMKALAHFVTKNKN